MNARTPRQPTARSTDQRKTARIDAQMVGGAHYQSMEMTPWEIFDTGVLTLEECRGYHKANALVYLMREKLKGGAEDVSKARHHLQKLEEIDAKVAAASK